MSKTNFDRDLYLANKSEIASAFGALEQADNISEDEKAVIRRCLSNYNSMLDASKEEDNSPDAIIASRIMYSFKLWHSVTDLDDTIKGLQRMYPYCKNESEEALHNITTLLIQFNEDIKREIVND